MSIKKVSTITILLLFCLHWLNVPSLITSTTKLDSQVPTADAAYQFTASSETVTTSGGTAGNYINTRVSDNDYMRILTTGAGLDVTYTLDEVRLWNANRLIVMYDGLASANTLTYQIQIRDFTNSTWRNILPHDANYTNIADHATAGMVLATATTGGLSGGYFEIYDGYFTNGSNTPVSTPMGNFVNSSNQVQIRLYSAVATANLELSVDLLAVQAANTPVYYPTSRTKNGSGAEANEYNDLTSDEATTSYTNAGAVGGISTDFYFKDVSIPYSDANTILLEYSGHISTSNYTVSLYDYNDAAYQAFNATVFSHTADRTDYLAIVPSTLTDTMADYIDEANNNTMNIRVTSAATSGTLTIDMMRLTLGSTIADTGIYEGALTRGTTSTGTDTNTRTVDTSAADSAWVLNSSNTSGLAAETEIHGDCSAATNQCVGGNFTLPLTLPANSISQGLITYIRFNTSNVALDVDWYTKRYDNNYQQIGNSANIAAMAMMGRELANPARPIIGAAAIAIPTYTPQKYIDSSTNSVNIRFLSTASDTTARTATIDFVFVSAKTLLPLASTTYRYQPTDSTLTIGTNNASNYTATFADDTTYWTVTQNGTTGTDVYLSFANAAVPTGANKIIITSEQAWSAATTSFEMYIYDFTNTTWRDMTPHEGTLTSGTAGQHQYLQYEIFDGYFSNGSNTPISTPLSNFISGGEMRVRLLSASTTSALSWDFAQVQLVVDPSYLPASRTLTTGSGTNEYNDTYTDEGVATTTTCNSSTFCYFVTPSSNTAEFYFTFDNVATPPEGFNSVMLEFSGFKATAGTYELAIKNFTTNSWENIATGLNNTADATHYFLYEIGNWQNYISSGDMQIRVYSTGNANLVYVDFIQLTQGMVPQSGSILEESYGNVTNGTIAALGNMNTITNINEFDPTYYATTTSANTESGIRGNDELAGKAIRIDFPMTKDPGTTIAGIIWALRGQSGSTSLTLSPSIDDPGGHFRLMTSNFMYSLTTASGLPTAADTATLAIASQTFRQGWYVDQLEDLWESTDDHIKFRLSTTASTVNTDLKLILDAIFLSYRWVPSATTSNPEDQMRGGKWFFGGEEQKHSF